MCRIFLGIFLIVNVTANNPQKNAPERDNYQDRTQICGKKKENFGGQSWRRGSRRMTRGHLRKCVCGVKVL